MTGYFVLVIVLVTLVVGSIVTRSKDEPSTNVEHLRRSRTRPKGALLLRLRLLAHVLGNGCRIVAADTLECRKCQYESVCQHGYFAPKA
jgi:hypothetical protein